MLASPWGGAGRSPGETQTEMRERSAESEERGRVQKRIPSLVEATARSAG